MIGLGSLFVCLFVCYVVSLLYDRFVVHYTVITQIYDRNYSNPNYSLFHQSFDSSLCKPCLFQKINRIKR